MRTYYKQVETLVSNILKLKELSVGDVVSHKEYGELKLVDLSHFKSYWYGENNEGALIDEWLHVNTLTIVRKRITLSMVLDAFKIRNDNTNDFDLPTAQEEMMFNWQLRKDGNDLCLFDQPEAIIDFIFNIL